MPYGFNTVYIAYQVLSDDSLPLRLRPFLDHHRLDTEKLEAESRCALTVRHDHYEVDWGDDTPILKLAIRPHDGVFVAGETASQGVLYRIERDRGDIHVGSSLQPRILCAGVAPHETRSLVASTEGWDSLERDALAAGAAERRRLANLLARAPAAAHEGLGRHLVLAADQFIITPASRMEELSQAKAAGMNCAR